jgi:hypothetical protein
MKILPGTVIAVLIALFPCAPATLLAQSDIQDAAQRLGKPATPQTPAIRAPGSESPTDAQPATGTTPEPGPAATPEPGAGTTPAADPGPATSAPSAEASPAWVKGGCQTFSAFTGLAVICGQGSMSETVTSETVTSETVTSATVTSATAAPSTAGTDVCMTAAANRAQTDIATELIGMLQEALEKAGCAGSVVNDSSTTAGKDGASTTTRAIRTRISGTRLAARWISAAGECHALVTIDLDGFQKSVFDNCGAPESTRKKTYEAAKAVWDAHFTKK